MTGISQYTHTQAQVQVHAINTLSSIANQTASLSFWLLIHTMLNTFSSIANQTASLPLAM